MVQDVTFEQFYNIFPVLNISTPIHAFWHDGYRMSCTVSALLLSKHCTDNIQYVNKSCAGLHEWCFYFKSNYEQEGDNGNENRLSVHESVRTNVLS